MPDPTLTREQIRAALERHSDFWDAYGGAPAEITDGIGMRLIQEDVPTLAATALAAMEERDALAARCGRLAEALRRHECQHVECSDIDTHAGCHAKAVLRDIAHESHGDMEER